MYDIHVDPPPPTRHRRRIGAATSPPALDTLHAETQEGELLAALEVSASRRFRVGPLQVSPTRSNLSGCVCMLRMCIGHTNKHKPTETKTTPTPPPTPSPSRLWCFRVVVHIVADHEAYARRDDGETRGEHGLEPAVVPRRQPRCAAKVVVKVGADGAPKQVGVEHELLTIRIDECDGNMLFCHAPSLHVCVCVCVCMCVCVCTCMRVHVCYVCVCVRLKHTNKHKPTKPHTPPKTTKPKTTPQQMKTRI
jgi:hypothetical protein